MQIFSKFETKNSYIFFCEHEKIISLSMCLKRDFSSVDFETLSHNSSLTQISILGDKFYRGYSQGQSYINSSSSFSFRLLSQDRKPFDEEKFLVKTMLKNDLGCVYTHNLIYSNNTDEFEVFCSYQNNSLEEQTIEIFPSFVLSGITPYKPYRNSLIINRVAARWSAEGRVESDSLENMSMEESWANFGIRQLKFGSVGSMPIRGYFPFFAIEDKRRNCTFGGMIEAPFSWQIELLKTDSDKLQIMGGAADFTFGHNRKTLKSGESITSFKAVLGVVSGGLDELSNELCASLGRKKPSINDKTSDIIYNEYCDTWGNPTSENVKRAVDYLKGKGVKYFVIDAGWYRERGKDWVDTIGDWQCSREYFKDGLKDAVDYIKANGMVAGIWLEAEVAAHLSRIYNDDSMFLRRDGRVIVSKDRKFFDFRKANVREFLRERIIKCLKEWGFGYIKLDYNEAIGIGCDGAESYGEGLREHIMCYSDFLDELRREIPDIVIETCASGGHRNEPYFISRSDMVSFSDAHECDEGAIIAGLLHRVIPPLKSQIWAVVKPDMDERQILFSIAKGFLGRLCLSGKVYDLNEEQWKVIERAIALYKRYAFLIENGDSFINPSVKGSYIEPKGCQAVYRYSKDKKTLMVIYYSFDLNGKTVSLRIPKGYSIIDKLTDIETFNFERNEIRINQNFIANVVIFRK